VLLKRTSLEEKLFRLCERGKIEETCAIYSNIKQREKVSALKPSITRLKSLRIKKAKLVVKWLPCKRPGRKDSGRDAIVKLTFICGIP